MMRLLTAVDGKWLYFKDHNIAASIIRSPCPIYRVEVYSYRFGDKWIDVTNKYSEYIKQKKGKSMIKIKALPVFDVGQVIDLSYKYGGMPNRIYIKSVFWREQDEQWTYQVMMENNGEDTDMTEQFINDHKSKNNSAVCKNPDIIKRFEDGWRFCGNFDNDVAMANGKLLAQKDNIKSVRIYPAINYRNQYVNGQGGIWVKYMNTIYDNGQITDQRVANSFVDIK